ncbi:MAG: isoaspartyl peptidase/L-asparaginase [Myxococcales bacterium]|nr:isoaspartyl peptidase/L-asparaginase [Myxococcales bacterium]
MPIPTLVIHGGAGLVKAHIFAEHQEADYQAGLSAALAAGLAVLAAGGPALDAAQRAVEVLEDHPGFNAGRGAVYAHEGHIELDASIMCGATGRAGAVAGVRTLRHPIQGARVVLERSAHVLLAGAGADTYCAGQGVATAPPAHFHTDLRWQQLQAAKTADRIALDHDGAPGPVTDAKLGTVGAVALDAAGRLAAATSTGGMTNKRWGRIGDSPLIGAGTFADGRVAISCTGHGEHFMRHVAAHAVAQRVELLGEPLGAACQAVLDRIEASGGLGGLIAVDAGGAIALPFNTGGMFRGHQAVGGPATVAIW